MDERFRQYKNLFKVQATDGNQQMQYYGTDPCVRFHPRRRFAVGIDPATKNTGVYVRSIDEDRNPALRKLRVLMDISNRGLPNKEIYFMMLVDLFKNIFNGIQIDFVFIEEPFKDQAFSSMKEKLTEFRGLMNLLKMDVPAFYIAQFYFVQPGTWRKHFLSDKRHDGMRRDRDLLKAAAMEETVCRYPKLEEYGRSFRRIPDSYDAVGILEGGAEEVFYNNHWGLRRFSSIMKPKVQNYFAYYDTVSVCEPNIEDFVEKYLEQGYGGNTRWILQDRGLSVYVVDDTEGCSTDYIVSSIVSETNKVCMIIFKSYDRYLDVIRAGRKNLNLSEEQAFFCIAWRASETKKVLDGDSYTSFIELPKLFGVDGD